MNHFNIIYNIFTSFNSNFMCHLSKREFNEEINSFISDDTQINLEISDFFEEAFLHNNYMTLSKDKEKDYWLNDELKNLVMYSFEKTDLISDKESIEKGYLFNINEHFFLISYFIEDGVVDLDLDFCLYTIFKGDLEMCYFSYDPIKEKNIFFSDDSEDEEECILNILEKFSKCFFTQPELRLKFLLKKQN